MITTCTLCKRRVTQPRQVAGLGPVGSECHERVAGLESFFQAVQGMDSEHPHAAMVAALLRDLGLRARWHQSGHHYRLVVHGLLRGANPERARRTREALRSWCAAQQEVTP